MGFQEQLFPFHIFIIRILLLGMKGIYDYVGSENLETFSLAF